MPEEVIIAEIDNFTYQALRRYFTAHDIDLGTSPSHVWDLRSGAVNRWPEAHARMKLRHIRYTLYFRRDDELDAFQYAQEHGRWPDAPGGWRVVWEQGTNRGEVNPEHLEWFDRTPKNLQTEEEFSRWVQGDPPPPEYLPNPENWGPDRAREELERIIPEAQRALVEDDPRGLSWGEQRFIIDPPAPGGAPEHDLGLGGGSRQMRRAPAPLTVAEVGAFKRQSREDQIRRTAAMIEILELDPDFAAGSKKFEAINLVDGRDFLREVATYDMVILHSILSPSVGLTRFKGNKELMTSPDHTVEVWRNRLVSTGAKYIVVCEGQPYTLSGRELGDLPGYDAVKSNEWLAVYKRS
jgi:hypothetical protein